MEISREMIRKYCGAQSYAKGEDCKAFIKAFVQKNAIFGLYDGSVDIYSVNIILEGGKPVYSWCACSAMGQYDATCKHIAGLLLLWHEMPEKLAVLDSWENLLAGYDEAALRKLLIEVASQSIGVTCALYEKVTGSELIAEDELCDDEDECEDEC